VASSSAEHDAGFATPAAVVVALVLAIGASALTARSVMEDRLAKRDFERVRADYALAGAAEEAALALVGMKQDARLAWTAPSPLGPVSILAEPQNLKLTPTAAADAIAEDLVRLGVSDGPQLQARLRAFGDSDVSDFAVEAADASPAWRQCARSLISPYGGTGIALDTTAPTTPLAGSPAWRIGSVWRVRLSLADGWVDDRIVRFTGEPLHPAAVVERRLTRANQGSGACDQVLNAKPA